MVQVQSIVSTSGKRELFDPTFTGETITVKDMMNLAGVSKVTILKLIKGADLLPVGKVASGGRGRPAALYDRDSFLTLLKNRGDTVGNTVESDAVAGIPTDKVGMLLDEASMSDTYKLANVLSNSDRDTLSVDEINQALNDLE